MSKSKQYSNIFKSTFLFSIVQVIRILVNVIKNKVVAVLLGPEGVGIMGIMQNTINLIKTGAGLGISQSAVKDVAEANATSDKMRLSRVMSVTQRVVLYTSSLGFFITLILSPLLSKWGFGNSFYTISFVFLGIAIFFEIFVENQLAILKGARKLKSLAKASIWGAVTGLIVGVPLYFFMGVKGIVPSFIATSFVVYLVTKYYINEIEYTKIKLTLKEVFCESQSMLKMGVALMIVALLGTIYSFVISAYLRAEGGLVVVGLYQAGSTIVTSYIGVVITAMSTDYYPRIAAVNKDNIMLTEEVNTQSEVGMLMSFPIVVVFVFLSPFFIEILYSADFSKVIIYTDYAIIGSIITICSNCMGMILLAKQASRLFLISVISQRVICLFMFFFLYQKYGLLGLGFSEIFVGIVHIVYMSIIMGYKYSIKFRKRILMQLMLVIISVLISEYIRELESLILRYTLAIIIIICVSAYSLEYSKRYMNIDFVRLLKNKFKK